MTFSQISGIYVHLHFIGKVVFKSLDLNEIYLLSITERPVTTFPAIFLNTCDIKKLTSCGVHENINITKCNINTYRREILVVNFHRQY